MALIKTCLMMSLITQHPRRCGILFRSYVKELNRLERTRCNSLYNNMSIFILNKVKLLVTHTADFKKLLNALKLYGRVYSTKDTNLKILRSLPKEWKPMTISLRHSHEFKDYNLEKLYGVLKTYEMEIQQD